MLRKPSCGAQNCFCLGAASNFDRCAITASLYPPPAALRRRCPARSACLGEHNPFTQQKTRYRKSDTLFLAGAEGLEVASQPLLRCPKYGGVTPYFDRCAILASLHLPPAALRRRCPARSACLGGHKPFTTTKNKVSHFAIPCFWQGQKDLNLLRKPSCGAQNCFCLGAASNFDRCAITASLYPPPAALRRRCPARSACLEAQVLLHTKKKDTAKAMSFFLAGAEGLDRSCKATSYRSATEIL